MTKLNINICAEDDTAAMEMLLRLLKIIGKEPGVGHLNDAGYDVSRTNGSGTFRVIRIPNDVGQTERVAR